jgi:hypothetical protein
MVAWQPVGLAVGVYDMYVMHLRHTYCILSDLQSTIMLKTKFFLQVCSVYKTEISV